MTTGRRVSVPLSLLRELIAYLERGVGPRRRFDSTLSLLIDGLRETIEGGGR